MPYYISNEEKVNAYPSTDFMAFYQDHVNTGTWKQASGINSFYGFVINKKASKCVVISQGRSESLVKYAEFIYELYQNGYSVFMSDHQGQGQSTRILSNRHMGYVKHFNDYVNDMHVLIERVLTPVLLKHNQGEIPKVLICHSMGGAIGALYVQAYPNVFSLLIMTSPMMGVLTPLSESLTMFIFKVVQKTRDILGLDNGYVWGQSDYQAYPFEQNRLTNCKVRYRVFREMMADYPHNQLGGISFMWLLQAIYAMRALRAQAANIVLPTLVFQAEQEHIVDNQKVTQFVKSLPAATFVTVAKAQHELLFEKDEVRESVVRQIFDFLNTSSVSKH